MKIDQELKVKDKIEIQKEVEKQLKLDGEIIPHGNHTIFEIEQTDSGIEIRVAEFEKAIAEMVNGKLQLSNKQCIKKPNCFYVSALKKETALKKFLNGNNGSRFDKTKAIDIDVFPKKIMYTKNPRK
jgi:hypothetical protein